MGIPQSLISLLTDTQDHFVQKVLGCRPIFIFFFIQTRIYLGSQIVQTKSVFSTLSSNSRDTKQIHR